MESKNNENTNFLKKSKKSLYFEIIYSKIIIHFD